MTEKLEFQGLDAVLAHFDNAGSQAQTGIKTYRSQVKELTGHDPTQPVTPLDVVKIVQRVFFGGSNAVDSDGTHTPGSSGGHPFSAEAAPPHSWSSEDGADSEP